MSETTTERLMPQAGAISYEMPRSVRAVIAAVSLVGLAACGSQRQGHQSDPSSYPAPVSISTNYSSPEPGGAASDLAPCLDSLQYDTITEPGALQSRDLPEAVQAEICASNKPETVMSLQVAYDPKTGKQVPGTDAETTGPTGSGVFINWHNKTVVLTAAHVDGVSGDKCAENTVVRQTGTHYVVKRQNSDESATSDLSFDASAYGGFDAGIQFIDAAQNFADKALPESAVLPDGSSLDTDTELFGVNFEPTAAGSSREPGVNKPAFFEGKIQSAKLGGYYLLHLDKGQIRGGGSGGPVYTKDGKLAGLSVGDIDGDAIVVPINASSLGKLVERAADSVACKEPPTQKYPWNGPLPSVGTTEPAVNSTSN